MEDQKISFYRNSKGGLQIQGETYFEFVNQIAPKIEELLDKAESIIPIRRDRSYTVSAKITLIIRNVE